MGAAKDIVTVDGLTKSYAGRPAVNGISFSVQEGEIFGILGPNGAGKTTTLEMLETLRTIDGGTATIDGIDVVAQPEKIRYLIGVQTQGAAFYDKLKLVEQIRMFASFYGRKVDEGALLDAVQLGEQANQYPERLSGGQRQRLSIATALVNEPRVLFLDEPTTGLDPQARRNMWELIATLKQRGITVLLTTHYMDEAELLCDRIAIVDNGAIIALGAPKQLIAEFKERERKQDADLEDVFIGLTGKALRE